MLSSDTHTMLTARRRLPIGVVEQKLVDTTDPEHPNNRRVRAAHDELAADARRGLRCVHEAMDPGRVQEREPSQVNCDCGRSVLQDLAEELTQGLDGREI